MLGAFQVELACCQPPSRQRRRGTGQEAIRPGCLLPVLPSPLPARNPGPAWPPRWPKSEPREAGAGVQPHGTARPGVCLQRDVTGAESHPGGFGCIPPRAQRLLPFPCLGNPCEPQPRLSHPRSPRPSTIPTLARVAKSWSASRKGRWLPGRRSRRAVLIFCINTS